MNAALCLFRCQKTFRSLSRTWGPLLLSISGFLLICGLFLRQAFFLGNGHVAYILDDPYIHMAMARNIALHGVYGVTPHEWSGCSSSPVWTLLLAGVFRIFGVREWMPLVLNLAFSCATLAVIDSYLRRHGVGGWARLVVEGVVTVTGALTTLVAIGMEHSLHCCLFLSLLFCAERVLDDQQPRTFHTVATCILAGLATGVRYETAFLTGSLVLLLAWRRRWRMASLLASATLLPIVIYGLFSVAHGSFFFPNTLVVKAGAPTSCSLSNPFAAAWGLIQHCILYFCYDPSMAVVLFSLPSAWILLRVHGASARLYARLVALLSITLLVHAALIWPGNLYRYSVYVFVAGACLVAVPASQWLQNVTCRRCAVRLSISTLVIFCGALLAFGPLLHRAEVCAKVILSGCASTYQLQVQKAQFVREMLRPGARVAIHDIGAVCFYADIHMLDLAGLGNVDVTRRMSSGRWDADQQARAIREHGTQFVMVFPRLFGDDRSKPRLPTNLIAVASWRLDHQGTCEDGLLTFYGTSPAYAQELSDALCRYAHVLPKEVHYQQHYFGPHAAESPDDAP